jgi:hypothetical protein
VLELARDLAINPVGSGNMNSNTMSAMEVGCSVLSLLFLLQLVYRSLIDILGEWFARNSVILIFPLLVLSGIVGNIALSGAGQGRFTRLCCWIAVGIAYLDMKSLLDALSEGVFSSSQETVTDNGILMRGTFLVLACSWMSVVSIGYLLSSYIKIYYMHRGYVFLVGLVINIFCFGSFLMLWLPEPPYPDCTIPLLGSIVASVGLLIELPKELRFWGSVIVALGISYAFNSYLSCSYCGRVIGATHPAGQNLYVVWKCPLRSGTILQIVEGTPNGVETKGNESLQLRAMRLGHSMMGGIWIKPQSAYGVSIFSAFHLQAAGALFTNREKSNGEKKSLHIGLGAGTSLKVLQRIGYSCDCVELHPEILAAAKEFFNLQGTACQVGDAGQLINHMSLEKYEVINLDIFSGDTDMSLLKKRNLFRKLSSSMMHSAESVLVVNFFGLEGQQLKTLYTAIKESFVAVRMYREEPSDDDISNFVLVASNSGKLQGIDPVPILDSDPYSTAFSEHKDRIVDTLAHREISTRGIRSACTEYRSVIELFYFKACVWMENLRASGYQWRSFTNQFT